MAEMERKYDEQFKVVFEAIRQLMAPPERERKKIGFEVKEAAGGYGKRARRHREGRAKEAKRDKS